MKLGLITDIHEHVDNLRIALDYFQNVSVDQVVMIGDVFRMGKHIEETCQLLKDANVVGVWGNHDFGLCVNVNQELKEQYPPVVNEYMTSLKPRLDVADCHFTHIEPWLDPENIEDLWYFEGPPDRAGNLARIFDSVPSRIMFVGHYHKWLLADPEEIQQWAGECSIELGDGRHFVVVDALCEGSFATFDTESSLLVPLRC